MAAGNYNETDNKEQQQVNQAEAGLLNKSAPICVTLAPIVTTLRVYSRLAGR